MKKVDGKPALYNYDWTVDFHPGFERYNMELDFWTRLDHDLYNWTYKFPVPLGTIFRIIFSILMMNHRNPVPISHNEHVAHLWWDKPQWVRYLLWRVRNPWEDLRKLYLGFGWAFYADKLWRVELINKHKTKLYIYAPYKIPLFPYFEKVIGSMELAVGFKKRGLFSISFARD